jgi:hypothetical protein
LLEQHRALISRLGVNIVQPNIRDISWRPRKPINTRGLRFIPA